MLSSLVTAEAEVVVRHDFDATAFWESSLLTDAEWSRAGQFRIAGFLDELEN
jgi:hypothetical protein